VIRARGQAAVETALTMPLLIFMLLGTLQLFTLLQGRILAQYAAGRATRMGAINHAKCEPMVKSAITILMPAIDSSFANAGPGAMGAAFANQTKRRTSKNLYDPAKDSGRDGPVVWIDRVRPLVASIDPSLEEDIWNLPEGPDRTLEVRMTFWFPLKIPFANWAFARLAMAHWGVEEYHDASPYMMAARDAKWTAGGGVPPSAQITTEMKNRFYASPPQYVFPIQATYAMRMMSPPRYTVQNCQ
jgi:hypothetical protein